MHVSGPVYTGGGRKKPAYLALPGPEPLPFRDRSVNPACPGAARRLAGLVLGLLAAGAVGCKEPVRDPLGITGRLAPFERLPYLQAVDTSAATVRWLALASASDSLEARTGDADEWRSIPVERHDERTSPFGGTVATRTARLLGLRPGTEVSYRVWADTMLVGPFSFRTAGPPAAGETIRVLAFGDSGWGSRAQVSLAEQMNEGSYDLALHTGDIAYADGTEADFTLRHFQVYRSLFARVPFYPAVGNHDLHAEGGAAYRRAFVWDSPYPDARFYSHRRGRVLFLALDTTDEEETDWGATDGEPEADPEEVDYTDGYELRDGRGRQYEWLEAELAAARADSTIRWVIAYMHHPPYSFAVGLSGHGSDVDLEREVAPLFDAYGVDLVLSGHDHHYERSRPLHDDEIALPGCGPVYIVTGGGGASRFARGLGRSPIQAWSSLEHHFVRLEITEREIRGEAIGERGQTIDEFVIFPYEGHGPDGRPAGAECG